ncbi:alternate-type signal peptide domain-containing protein [Arthrobacter sp. TWP1-1]|uniref:alternate-type signal peptide domain-containing protein n=1 Tax=Arthrobacter sp. TWP1-1 TaxID=2804568 RepID=UPI003CF7E5C4
MAKGAIATGVGIILLAGGGGTLATWNQTVNTSIGSVVSGDLNLKASSTTPAVWTNAAGTVIPNIAAYKVVPGDVLTFKQNLDVTLVGDLVAANLTVTGLPTAQTANEVIVATVLKDGTATLPATLTQANANGHTITATTTFTFNAALGSLGTPVDGRQAVTKSYSLDGIGYKLEQLAPVA